jgi:hypothetical protein
MAARHRKKHGKHPTGVMPPALAAWRAKQSSGKSGGTAEGGAPPPNLAKARRGTGGLTAAARHALPATDFALSAKNESYPIPDASHARNALSRVSQFGSPAAKAKVRRKVHAKFPSIGS